MQNLRLQQTGDTSVWSIQISQVIWSVSIFLWSLIKLTVADLVRLFFLYFPFIHSLTFSSFVNMQMYANYQMNLSNSKYLCESLNEFFNRQIN